MLRFFLAFKYQFTVDETLEFASLLNLALWFFSEQYFALLMMMMMILFIVTDSIQRTVQGFVR